MSRAAAVALAPEFTHTTGAPDVTFTFASGVLSVPVSLASGLYRMCLAPLASDFLRALAAVITTELTTARSATYTCTASIAANGTLLLRVVSAAGLPTVVTFAAAVWKRLGYASATPTLSPGTGLVDLVGARPVWHLALITAATGPWWQPRQAGGSEQTTGGRVYTIAATGTSWMRSLAVTFQPLSPTERAARSCDATALYPDEAYMGEVGSLDTAREWSVLDVLYNARNAACGLTMTWGTTRVDTSARIWRVDVGGETLLSLETRLLKPAWLAYGEWTLALVGPSSTPTETRS